MNPKHSRSYFLNLTAVLIGGWIVFSWSVDRTAVQAAEPSKTQSQAGETKPAPPAPAAIPDSEIIPRAEQTVKSLQKVRSGIAADSTLSLIQREFAAFDRFADSALNFTLFCWAYVDTFFLARSELTIAIDNAFKQAGVQIPFPQQDVHVHWPDGRGPQSI